MPHIDSLSRACTCSCFHHNENKNEGTQYNTYQNNNFSHTIIQKLNSYIQHNLNAPNQNSSTIHNSKPCISFTYYSPVIQKITNLCKDTKVNITICSMNTIYNLIQPKIHSTIDKYTNSEVYELICATC
jgi:hypothetical protein